MYEPDPETVAEAVAICIAQDLRESIASLGYPVGLGVAPHPDTCLQWGRAMSDALWLPLFDDRQFAKDLQPVVQELGMREAARIAGVSPSTISRAAAGWPQLSHENYLRLTKLLAAREEVA